MNELPSFVQTQVIEVAAKYNHGYLTVEHAILALLKEPEVFTIVAGVGGDVEKLYHSIDGFLSGVTTEETFNDGHLLPDELFYYVIARTVGHAVGTINMANATVVDLFLSILTLKPESCGGAHMLFEEGVTLEVVARYLSENHDRVLGQDGGDMDGITFEPLGLVDTPKKVAPTEEQQAIELLMKYARNLNVEVAEGRIDPLIGREDEINRIIQVLSRRRKNNALLVGEPGIGKTAIVEGLALRIVRGDVPPTFKNKVIYSLDFGAVMAGTRYRGDFEERMKQIIDSVEKLPDAIIFIDEIHLMIGTGATNGGSMDASNILKPALARGRFRCIGATTFDDSRSTLEKDKALVRRFKKIPLSPPTVEQSKLIILGLRELYEGHHGVSFTVDAVSAAVDLVSKYIRDCTLPDRAIDVIDDVGARKRISASDDAVVVIDRADIEEEVAKMTAIPLSRIQESEGQAVVNLANRIRDRLHGQDDAILKVTDVIKVARAGLRPVNKPEGMFMFVGPTGVGKTELARAAAEELDVKLIKYDMSEFMEKHSVARLIGSPPGYVGHGTNAKLINDIEENPRCILLLDEIEKAHSDVFNILLQIMDDARLTSGSGKTVDFRNVILIMTSNVGVEQMARARAGLRRNHALEIFDEKELKKRFRPEFLNRLDAVVPFAPLDKETLIAVANKFLAQVDDHLVSRGIGFRWTEDVTSMIIEKGYDLALGARPIGRAVDELVRLPLANLLLSSSVVEGWAVSTSVDDGEIVFTLTPPELPKITRA